MEQVQKQLNRLEKKIDTLLKCQGIDNPAKKFSKAVSIFEIVSELKAHHSIRQTIMHVLQRMEGAPVNLLDIVDAFEKHGGFIKGTRQRKGDTAVAVISDQIKRGLILKVGPRIYKWNIGFKEEHEN